MGREEFDEHLVALHGGVDFVGRDEDVFAGLDGRSGGAALASFGADEAVAVAVEVESSGGEIVAGGVLSVLAKGPVVAVELGEVAGGGEAGELLDEQAAVAASGKRKLANELLIAGALAGGAFDAAKKLAVSH